MTIEGNVFRCDSEGCAASAPLRPGQMNSKLPPIEGWSSVATTDDDGNVVKLAHFCPDHPNNSFYSDSQARRLGLPPFDQSG